MRQSVVFSILFCIISKVLALPHVKEPCLLLQNRNMYLREKTLVSCVCEDLNSTVEEIFWKSARHGILANASLHNSANLSLILNYTNDGDVVTCGSTAGNITSMGDSFTLFVAYGPRSVNLTTSPASVVLDNCPLCNTTIRVTCLPDKSSPPAASVNITIYKNGTKVYNGTNPTASLPVSSGGTFVVACEARNARIPNLVSNSTRDLEIREVPPKLPVMFVNGQMIGLHHTLEENGNISIRCQINGGYPLVDKVTVQCGHLPGRTTLGSVANYSLYVTRDLNQAVCLCSGSHVTGRYKRTAQLVLDVQYPASITSFTINNHTDSLNISNNTQVHFSCEADGNPTPFITITSANGNELLQTGISPLNFTTSLPCDGPTAYVCQVNNSLGLPAVSVVNVTVLCMKESQHLLDLLPIIVGVVVPAVTILIVISVLVCIFRYKKSRPSEPEPTALISDTNTTIGAGGTHLSGNYNTPTRDSQSSTNPYANFNNGAILREQASDSPEDYSCRYIPTPDHGQGKQIDSNAEHKQRDSHVEEPSVEIIPRVPVEINTKNIEEASLPNLRKKPPTLPKKNRRQLEASDSLKSDKSPYKVPCTSTRLAS